MAAPLPGLPTAVAQIVLLLLKLVPDAIGEIKRLQAARNVAAKDKAADAFVDAALADPTSEGPCNRVSCPLRCLSPDWVPDGAPTGARPPVVGPS